MINSWLAGFVGVSAAPVVGFILLFGLVLLAVFVLFAVLRRLGGGTFVAGGRNRVQRLAVMDAAAVDGRRRLVLVRRDDVEHLILIGGPTDVVVEQNIRHSRQGARPAPEDRPSPQRTSPQAEGIAERPAGPQLRARAQVDAPAPQADRQQPALAPTPASSGDATPAKRVSHPVAEARPGSIEQPAAMPERRPPAAVRPSPVQRDETPSSAPARPMQPEPRPLAASPEPVLGPLAPDDRLGPADRDRPGREPPPGLGGPLHAREPTVDLDDAFDAEFSEMFTRELEAEQGTVQDVPDVTLPREDKKTDAPPPIEHEMERLLGELSRFEKK